MRIKLARLALVAFAAGIVGYLIVGTRRRCCSCGSAAYRGNEITRVFHDPSCRYAHAEHSTATFATPQEAIDAGYEPCQVCLP
jgi:hypothetical protein